VNSVTNSLGAVFYSTSGYDPVADPTGPYTMTQSALPLDPFLLPENTGSQIIESTSVILPVRQAFILPSVVPSSSIKAEGIDAYVTQNGGDNVINKVLITGGQGPNGALTIGNPVQIEDAGTGTIEGLSASFRTDNTFSGVPVMSTYDIAWDSYAGGVDTIQFQIFNADGSASSGLVTAATSATVSSFLNTPAYSFHGGSGAYVLAEAVNSTVINNTLNLTGQAHDAIQFTGYNPDGTTFSIFSNPFQPDLSHYAALAVNHITQESSGSGAQALQFLQVSASNNNDYFIAWNESVVDSNGSHDQVELVAHLSSTINFRQTFQIADGLAQNVRVAEWSDPSVAGQDDVVLAYGDASGTHLVEYSVNTSGGTTTVNQIASVTDPTTSAFIGITNFGDGRIGVSYDNVLDASQTSQDLLNVYDFRTTGVNINDSALSDGQSKYVAGTHFNDTFTGENNDTNFYYFVGKDTSTSAPTDHFNGGTNAAWNEAIFADARSNYTVSTTNGVTTVTNIDPLHAHAGQLIVDQNVEALAFNPAHDPAPNSDGSIEATGDTLLVLSPFAHAAQIDAGATLEFAGADSGSVTFNGSTGTLHLDDPADFTGEISGLSGSDGIDLKGFDDNSINVAHTSTTANTVLTITDATHTGATAVTITLLGDYTNSTFTHSVDASGSGVTIVDPPASGGQLAGVIMNDPGPAASQTIVASAPNQTLTGTGASNNFVFNFANIGHDTVTDFHPGTDTLQFGGAIFANAQAVLNATLDDGHGNTVVSLDAHDAITLSGVIKAQLHAADFHF
jgi:hypothetical protein